MKIAVIGLGYVGLPLALVLSKKYNVVGFDSSTCRINDLQQGIDTTNMISTDELRDNLSIKFTGDKEELDSCSFYIIAVPTPITTTNQPDLSYLHAATLMIAASLSKGDVVVYESTVYPGCTEEYCVPILAQQSKLEYNQDFFCGYSPERINPGDKKNTIETIVKVTSGSTPDIAEYIDSIYRSVIPAGTHKAPSIKVAEASKVIENSQRDLNISFVNELALIFDRLEIDTLNVLEAANTKWNFLHFTPGLVGGHCIGVDPWYLVAKAESVGYHPDVVLSGRRVNETIGTFIASKVVKLMSKKRLQVADSSVLVFGASFKANCQDIRNSKVFDLIDELLEFGCQVSIFDPFVNPDKLPEKYATLMCPLDYMGKSTIPESAIFTAVVFAVDHDVFKSYSIDDIRSKVPIIFDVKGIFPREKVDARL